MGIVAISAHLDDAALSASASLAGRDATVLTVFAGMPPPEVELASWDELTGATSSARRQAERLAEDAEAMRLLSASGRYLDVLDSQYRVPGRAPDLDRDRRVDRRVLRRRFDAGLDPGGDRRASRSRAGQGRRAPRRDDGGPGRDRPLRGFPLRAFLRPAAVDDDPPGRDQPDSPAARDQSQGHQRLPFAGPGPRPSARPIWPPIRPSSIPSSSGESPWAASRAGGP